MRTPYSEQASLEISHELGGGGSVCEFTYSCMGLRSEPSPRYPERRATGTLPSGKPIFARALGGRRFLELGDFFSNDDIAFSIHHGGSFEIEKRFSRGFSFHSSYTFSKTINNSDSVANLADLPEGPDISQQRSVSRQSVPHRFTLAFVSEIPEKVPVLGSFKFGSLLTARRPTLQRIRRPDANGGATRCQTVQAPWAETRCSGRSSRLLISASLARSISTNESPPNSARTSSTCSTALTSRTSTPSTEESISRCPRIRFWASIRRGMLRTSFSFSTE